MSKFSIRPYEERDWDRICEIHDRARIDELRGSVDLGVFRPLKDVAGPEGLFDSRLWVAENGDTVLGFAGATESELTWLYVDPGAYGQGVGRALVRHALAHCGPVVTVMVLAGNTAAISLYQSEGFVEAERVPLRFSEGDQYKADGLILRWERSSDS